MEALDHVTSYYLQAVYHMQIKKHATTRVIQLFLTEFIDNFATFHLDTI